jgi:hypothetical protein
LSHMVCTHSHCNIMILLKISPSQNVMIVHTTLLKTHHQSSFCLSFSGS